MDWETVEQTTQLLANLAPKFIAISGGEPTCHPEWDRSALHFIKFTPVRFFTIISNGFFVLDDSQVQKMHKVLQTAKEKGVEASIQTSSDVRFYLRHQQYRDEVVPKLIEQFAKYKVYCETQISSKIMRMGRARYFKEAPEMMPQCLNPRLAAMQLPSLPETIYHLEQRGQLCKPAVRWDGALMAGECAECEEIGHVTSDMKTIMDALVTSDPCNKCQCFTAKYQEIFYNIRSANP